MRLTISSTPLLEQAEPKIAMEPAASGVCIRRSLPISCPMRVFLILSHSTDAPLSCVLLASTSPALVLLTAILAPRALTSPIDLFLPPATTRRCGQHKQHNCKRSRITSIQWKPCVTYSIALNISGA
jgi:hypothetical protein